LIVSVINSFDLRIGSWLRDLVSSIIQLGGGQKRGELLPGRPRPMEKNVIYSTRVLYHTKCIIGFPLNGCRGTAPLRRSITPARPPVHNSRKAHLQ